MSRENVELVREMNRAFNRHEDRWLDFYHPDVEYVMPPEWPEDHVYRGREALRGLLSALTVFEGQEWRLERVIDVGEDCVVALASVHARIQGQVIDQRAAAVHYLREGKVIRQLTYSSWDEALKAAGLEE